MSGLSNWQKSQLEVHGGITVACGYCGAECLPPHVLHCKRCGRHYHEGQFNSKGDCINCECEIAESERPKKEYVYFIGDQEHVKIGFTGGSALRRLDQLQTGNPRQLILYGVIEGGRSLEKRLHEHFDIYRVEGEWFRLTEEIRACMKARCDPGY